ncbi:YfaZ family outer membrane protein [Pandoraea anapnoica]|uniref:YfaZ family outer membrane protein n=1 Tax=Pandoraea TaxID=93217 RepID=UPI0035205053
MCVGLTQVPTAEAANYVFRFGDRYQELSRDPVGEGPGLTFDAARSSNTALAVGPGISIGLKVAGVSLGVGAKALYVSSSSGNGGLATPFGLTASVGLASHLALSGRAYYTPGTAFNSRLGGYSQFAAGLQWSLKPVVVEAGWRYESLGGRRGAPDSRLINGAYAGVGLSF